MQIANHKPAKSTQELFCSPKAENLLQIKSGGLSAELLVLVLVVVLLVLLALVMLVVLVVMVVLLMLLVLLWLQDCSADCYRSRLTSCRDV